MYNFPKNIIKKKMLIIQRTIPRFYDCMLRSLIYSLLLDCPGVYTPSTGIYILLKQTQLKKKSN